MKKPLASFLSVLALSLVAACSSGDSAAVGVYHLDVDAIFASMPQTAAMDAKAKEEAKKAMNMSGSIDLKADHTASTTMSMMGTPTTETGTWKLDGKTLTFTHKKDGKDEQHTGTLADGAITVTEEKMGQKMTMVFKKK